MSALKLFALTGLIGISVSGCILPPNDYSRRSVVRYSQPYPVYQDRYYTTVDRVYVPNRTRQRIYVTESPVIYSHDSDYDRRRFNTRPHWRDDDRQNYSNSNWQHNRDNYSNRQNRPDEHEGRQSNNTPSNWNNSRHENRQQQYAHDQHDARAASRNISASPDQSAKRSPQNANKRFKKNFFGTSVQN